MKQVADGLWHLRGLPPNAINVFLAEDVLIDAGTRRAERRILRQIDGHAVTAHALTHAHPDHQGASHAVCERFGIPLWCGEGDVEAMETGTVGFDIPDHWTKTLQRRFWTGPAHPVARALREGDEVAGFKVLDVPGHSRGHVAYWRESDGVLIAGDVLNNMNVATGIPGLHEPLKIFTPDPARNRESARKLAALEPTVVVFGHGPALRDTKKFVDFVAGLARD